MSHVLPGWEFGDFHLLRHLGIWDSREFGEFHLVRHLGMERGIEFEFSNTEFGVEIGKLSYSFSFSHLDKD